MQVHRDMLLRSEVRAHEVSITMKELNELYYQRHLDMESLHSAPPPTGKVSCACQMTRGWCPSRLMPLQSRSGLEPPCPTPP